MVRLEEKVTPVGVVVLLAVLAVHFESTVRQHPPSEQRRELVTSIVTARADGERALVESLKGNAEVFPCWPSIGPQVVKEPRGANLQTRHAARLEAENHPGHETTGGRRVGADAGIRALCQRAVDQPSMHASDPEIDGHARADERMWESSGVVAQDQRIRIAWAPGLVGSREAESEEPSVQSNRRRARIENTVRPVSEALGTVYAEGILSVAKALRTRLPIRHQRESFVLGPKCQ